MDIRSLSHPNPLSSLPVSHISPFHLYSSLPFEISFFILPLPSLHSSPLTPHSSHSPLLSLHLSLLPSLSSLTSPQSSLPTLHLTLPPISPLNPPLHLSTLYSIYHSHSSLLHFYFPSTIWNQIHDPSEDWLDPRVAAVSLLQMLARYRQKDTLPLLLPFMMGKHLACLLFSSSSDLSFLLIDLFTYLLTYCFCHRHTHCPLPSLPFFPPSLLPYFLPSFLPFFLSSFLPPIDPSSLIPSLLSLSPSLPPFLPPLDGLTEYARSPPETRDYQKKDSILVAIATCFKILHDSKIHRAMLEPLIITHILPEFKVNVYVANFCRMLYCIVVYCILCIALICLILASRVLHVYMICIGVIL